MLSSLSFFHLHLFSSFMPTLNELLRKPLSLLSFIQKLYYKLFGALRVLADSPAYDVFNDYEIFCKLISKARNHRFSSVLVEDASLDLGCGSNPRNPFGASSLYGIDLFVPNVTSACLIKQANLSIESIPFHENSFNYVTAHDFIEHVPRVLAVPNPTSGFSTIFPFVNLMSEIYRVLRPEGYFLSVTPAYPFSISFCDPTHVNFINEHTFKNYFSGSNAASIYGFKGSFHLVKQGFRGKYLISLLQAIK